MRSLLCFLIVVLGSIDQVFSQNAPTPFENYDPRRSSVTGMRIIQNSCGTLEANGAAFTYEDVDDSQFQEKYLDAFNQATSDFEFRRGAYYVGKELVLTGKDIALETFGKLLPYKNISKPVIDRLVDNLVELGYSKAVESASIDTEDAYRKILTEALAEKPGGVNSPDDLATASTLFRNLSQNQEQYPLFNRVFLERAFEFLQDNREQIIVNSNRIANNSKQLRQLREEVTALDGAFQQMKMRFNEELAEMSNSISVLERNQEQNTAAIQDLQRRVKRNTEQIRVIKRDLNDAKVEIGEIKSKLAEHKLLIDENRFYVETISSYLFNDLSLSQQVQAFENKAFPFIRELHQRDSNAYNAQLNQLQGIENREDFIQLANAAYKGFTAVGVLKGDDAIRVGQALNGITVGNALFNAFQASKGEPTLALASAVFQAMSLFGGGNSSSPELEMLKFLHQYLEEQFSIVNEKLDTINENIINLYKLEVEIYNSLYDEILLNREVLFDIRRELKDLALNLKRVEYLLLREYLSTSDCNLSSKVYSQIGLSFDSLDYGTLKEELKIYLPCYNKIASLLGRLGDYQNEIFIGGEDDKNRYDRMASYLSDKTSTEYLDYIFIGLTRPVPNYLVGQNSLRETLSLEPDRSFTKFVLQEFHNPGFLTSFLDHYLSFYVYINEFTYTDNAGNRAFYDGIEEYMSSSISQGELQLNRTQDDLLLEHLDAAIAQQSLLSGYLILDKLRKSIFYSRSVEEQSRALRILDENPVLERNFFNYIFRSSLETNRPLQKEQWRLQKYLELKREIEIQSEVDSTLVDSLNGLFLHQDLELVYVKQNAIQIKFTYLDEQERETLKFFNLPKASDLLNDEFHFTPSLYWLVYLRNSLTESYFDRHFPSYIRSGEAANLWSQLMINEYLQYKN